MQLSCLCSLALLSQVTWTACWMMWVNNCLPIMMYCLQHLLNLRKVRLEQWNGTFFEESSLQLASLVLHVGHGGKHCPAGGCSNDEVIAEEEDDWEDMPWGRGFTHTAEAGWDVSCYHKGCKDCIYLPRQCGMWYLSNEFLQQTLLHNLQCLSSSGARSLHECRRCWPWGISVLLSSMSSAQHNIPEDETDYSHWTLARSLVMDGNFKAEHMHPKDAGSEAWLMDGKGYMVASQPYKEYLSSTKNVVEVNMDYVLVHAIRHGTVPGQQVIHFYDINCQYSKGLEQQLHANAYISMPDGMQICPGIGLWHVHGHHTECFPQYAPNFIVGAGWVDGEIMETLWSSLNIISPSARGMATPHRQEATAMRLKQKLKVAEESYLVVEGRFADLNGNVPLAISQSWGEEAAAALENWLSRPQAMDIYEVRLQKGFVLSGIEAPSAKAIKIDLLAIHQPGHLQGMVTWIAKALKIEEAQIQLTVACQHITSRATEAENLTIACHHDHLQSHIHSIFDTAKKLFGDRFKDAELCWSSNLHDPETIALPLPSNVGKDHFE
ncbi:hypothetical protein F5J12DRAFT_783027 [Pisolithus orientalis]|uniref:uncharacterized protein n=1 Tax=Pisolithus orientalis TaxID=936130 RepID=UPI0022250590|nr:uncharacterized protein F5J12DRAFT_783027 [Pisolithus orientalis]KAI6006254.1 hypothetical protein F5J12DRAFT_783027 [Pisolithus orientalis]